MCERPVAPAPRPPLPRLAHTCPAATSRGLASVTGTTQTHCFLYDTRRCPWTIQQLSSDRSWLIPHSQPDEMFSPGPAHSRPSGCELVLKLPILASELPRLSTVSTWTDFGAPNTTRVAFPLTAIMITKGNDSSHLWAACHKSNSPLLIRAVQNGPTVARSLHPFYLVTLIKH